MDRVMRIKTTVTSSYPPTVMCIDTHNSDIFLLGFSASGYKDPV